MSEISVEQIDDFEFDTGGFNEPIGFDNGEPAGLDNRVDELSTQLLLAEQEPENTQDQFDGQFDNAQQVASQHINLETHTAAYDSRENGHDLFLNKDRENQDMFSGKGENRVSMNELFQNQTESNSAEPNELMSRYQNVLSELYTQGYSVTEQYFDEHYQGEVQDVYFADDRGRVEVITYLVSPEPKDAFDFDDELPAVILDENDEEQSSITGQDETKELSPIFSWFDRMRAMTVTEVEQQDDIPSVDNILAQNDVLAQDNLLNIDLTPALQVEVPTVESLAESPIESSIESLTVESPKNETRLEQPIYDHLTYQKPVYEQLVYGHPAYQEPVYEQFADEQSEQLVFTEAIANPIPDEASTISVTLESGITISLPDDQDKQIFDTTKATPEQSPNQSITERPSIQTIEPKKTIEPITIEFSNQIDRVKNDDHIEIETAPNIEELLISVGIDAQTVNSVIQTETRKDQAIDKVTNDKVVEIIQPELATTGETIETRLPESTGIDLVFNDLATDKITSVEPAVKNVSVLKTTKNNNTTVQQTNRPAYTTPRHHESITIQPITIHQTTNVKEFVPTVNSKTELSRPKMIEQTTLNNKTTAEFATDNITATKITAEFAKPDTTSHERARIKEFISKSSAMAANVQTDNSNNEVIINNGAGIELALTA